LRPLALCSIGGLLNLLLAVLHSLMCGVLGRIDALLELVTVIRSCSLHGCRCLGGLGLEVFELLGKVHRCSATVDWYLATPCALRLIRRTRGSPWSEHGLLLRV